MAKSKKAAAKQRRRAARRSRPRTQKQRVREKANRINNQLRELERENLAHLNEMYNLLQDAASRGKRDRITTGGKKPRISTESRGRSYDEMLTGLDRIQRGLNIHATREKAQHEAEKMGYDIESYKERSRVDSYFYDLYSPIAEFFESDFVGRLLYEFDSRPDPAEVYDKLLRERGEEMFAINPDVAWGLVEGFFANNGYYPIINDPNYLQGLFDVHINEFLNTASDYDYKEAIQLYENYFGERPEV